MQAPRKVLIATDYIEHSKETLVTAASVIKNLNASAILIHVIHDFQDKSFNSEMERRLQDAAELMADQGVSIEKKLLKEGKISEQLIKASEEENVGLIVIGYGRNESVKKGSLGSAAKEVISKSRRPILLVKKQMAQPLKKVLCLVDILETSRFTLNASISMAKASNADLTILHAIPENKSVHHLVEKTPTGEEIKPLTDAEKKLDEFLAKSDLQGVRWQKTIINGIDAHAISSYASENEYSCLIMGESTSGKWQQFFFGSLPEQILKITDLPCFLIKG